MPGLSVEFAKAQDLLKGCHDWAAFRFLIRELVKKHKPSNSVQKATKASLQKAYVKALKSMGGDLDSKIPSGTNFTAFSKAAKSLDDSHKRLLAGHIMKAQKVDRLLRFQVDLLLLDLGKQAEQQQRRRKFNTRR